MKKLRRFLFSAVSLLFFSFWLSGCNVPDVPSPLEEKETQETAKQDKPTNSKKTFITEKTEDVAAPAGGPKKEGAEAMAKNYEAYFSISEITDDIFNRIQGKSYPKDCPLELNTLRYITVAYVNFDGDVCEGELIVNKEIAEDIISIFQQLFKERYPIESIRLIDDYDANDDSSMAANNSSAFCYRVISGTNELSNHSFGLAVDINPLYNPYIKSNGQVLPAEAEAFADRTLSNPYYITPEDVCVRIFKEHGFSWGGDWKSSRDYQHFEYTP